MGIGSSSDTFVARWRQPLLELRTKWDSGRPYLPILSSEIEVWPRQRLRDGFGQRCGTMPRSDIIGADKASTLEWQ